MAAEQTPGPQQSPGEYSTRLCRIISGGQTGVDRGALDAALAAGVPHGGWCPAGRRAEDGMIPAHYQLTEMTSADYALRTEQNVLDSDGTLVLHVGELSGGTELTVRLAAKHRKPCLLIDLTSAPPATTVPQWLAQHQIEILNCAGPRESSSPGIQSAAKNFVLGVCQT